MAVTLAERSATCRAPSRPVTHRYRLRARRDHELRWRLDPNGKVRHSRRRAAVGHHRSRRKQERRAADHGRVPADRRRGDPAQRPADLRRRGDGVCCSRAWAPACEWLGPGEVLDRLLDVSIDTKSTGSSPSGSAPRSCSPGRCWPASVERVMPPPGGDVIGRRRLDPHLDAFRALGAHVEHARHHIEVQRPDRPAALRLPDG